MNNRIDEVDLIKKMSCGRFREVMDHFGIKHKGKLYHCWIHGADSTPSISVDEKRGFYKCFGCNNNNQGSIIDLVKNWNNWSLKESIEWCKSYFQTNNNTNKTLFSSSPINLTPTEPVSVSNTIDADDKYSFNEKREIRQKIESDFYYHCVKPEDAGQQYIDYWANRGISLDTLSFFRIKLLQDPSKVEHILRNKYSEDMLRVSGVFNPENLKFSFKCYRYMIPMFQGGDLVQIQGRDIIDRDNKYKNGYGGIPCLYNYNVLYSNIKEVYLVEGSPDVWSMKEMNKDNTVGIWGVANFKKNWVSDFAGKHVIIIMDNDVAGVNALVFLAEVMNEYKVSFEIRTVPAEFNDINDYLIWKKFKKKKDNKKMKEYLEIIQTEEYAKLKPYIRNAA